jgi:3-deoxy-D-manno-oct-2-ulosonic acid (Kdo) hydroxylase
MALIEISDFKTPGGWTDPRSSAQRSQECCRQLEEGHILFFPQTPFGMPQADLEFLTGVKQSDSALHKNISYRPKEDVLRGVGDAPAEAVQRLHGVMRSYSQYVTAFISQLLEPYAASLRHDFASFRAIEEQGRDLPVHRRNDLMHVDAFPTRPTRGDRILRCFTNVNPAEPRVWVTGEPISVTAQRFAQDAGLSRLVTRSSSPAGRIRKTLRHVLGPLAGKGAAQRTLYDEFMLGFHDYLKEHQDYQKENQGKLKTEFPPFSTWIVFTDGVPHSVLSGRLALEQTFIVPLNAMILPEKSPARVLEKIAGHALLA